MSVLSSVEQQGIRDLLVHHGEQNLAFDLARVVCKNMVKPASFEGKPRTRIGASKTCKQMLQPLNRSRRSRAAAL